MYVFQIPDRAFLTVSKIVYRLLPLFLSPLLVMSPPIATGKSESGTARFLGSASSGVLELLIFHPVDTVAKRLMSNQTRVSCMISGTTSNSHGMIGFRWW